MCLFNKFLASTVLPVRSLYALGTSMSFLTLDKLDEMEFNSALHFRNTSLQLATFREIILECQFIQ